MEKDQSSSSATVFSFRSFCCILVVVSSVSSISFFYWSQYYYSTSSSFSLPLYDQNTTINLLTYTSAWNHLTFSSDPPEKLLKIALFVKKWPQRNLAGGLERHALTLHLALAKRGHELHIFTTNSSLNDTNTNMNFHLSKPTSGGYLDQALVWNQFQIQNSTGKPFDVAHTESVGLMHTRAKNVKNLAVSWHGIAYETIHSDIIQEMVRSPEEQRSHTLTERSIKVVDEVKFFPRYSHHVATSDHCGDVLRRIYMIPDGPKHKVGIPDSETALVLGMAGRLVKDKGHPIMFEALSQIFSEQDDDFGEKGICHCCWRRDLWGADIENSGSNLEVTMSGKPVMATRFASITGSVIVGPEMGYTFSPTVSSLKDAILNVVGDGRKILEKKGQVARQRALKLFTATKMATAYERLFLCISNSTSDEDGDYCMYKPPPPFSS
ncbi:hypothetical protein MKW92_052221 [Papaver armeniacum]|nr:hypothetical protein MKW92_052221 [Papaver armeniacum]